MNPSTVYEVAVAYQPGLSSIPRKKGSALPILHMHPLDSVALGIEQTLTAPKSTALACWWRSVQSIRSRPLLAVNSKTRGHEARSGYTNAIAMAPSPTALDPRRRDPASPSRSHRRLYRQHRSEADAKTPLRLSVLVPELDLSHPRGRNDDTRIGLGTLRSRPR